MPHPETAPLGWHFFRRLNFRILIGIAVAVVVILTILANSSEADRRVTANTLWLGVFSAAIAIPLGASAAWAATGRHWICRLLLVSCIGLLVVPLFSHVSAWDSAWGRLGWVSSSRGEVLKPLLSGWPAAVWVHAIAATPQVAIIFLLGWATGKRTYEEQALLETTPFFVFWHVTLPRRVPLVLLSGLWIMISCSREIAVTDIFRIGTLAEQVYLGFSLGQFNSVQGNWTPEQITGAQSLGPFIGIAIIGTLSAGTIYFFSRLTRLELESSHWRPPSIVSSPQTLPRTITTAGLLAILVVMPVGNLIYRASFFVSSVNGKPTPGLSFEQLGNSLTRVFSQYQSEFYWSTVISLVSATFIIIGAVLVAWLARRSTPWRILFIAMLTFSCAVPGPLFGLWVSKLFLATTNPSVAWLYDRTIFAPVLTTCFFCWPIAGLVVWFAFRNTSVDMVEHAQLEGAGWLSQLVRIAVPNQFLSIAGCWLITLALCFGELSTTQMVLPPGMDTVPRLTLGLLHAGVDEMTAALTIVTVGGIISISLAGWLLVRLNHFYDAKE